MPYVTDVEATVLDVTDEDLKQVAIHLAIEIRKSTAQGTACALRFQKKHPDLFMRMTQLISAAEDGDRFWERPVAVYKKYLELVED